MRGAVKGAGLGVAVSQRGQVGGVRAADDLAALAVALTLWWLVGSPIPWVAVTTQALLLHPFHTATFDGVNPPAWTLAVEAQLYLAYPVVFPEAAWNVPLRMALYERAFVNLGVNNGPMGLAWLNARVCYATLKIETADVPQSSLGFIRSFGFELGKSLPFATPVQEWVWEDDTEEVITKTFERLRQRIEACSGSASARRHSCCSRGLAI